MAGNALGTWKSVGGIPTPLKNMSSSVGIMIIIPKNMET